MASLPFSFGITTSPSVALFTLFKRVFKTLTFGDLRGQGRIFLFKFCSALQEPALKLFKQASERRERILVGSFSLGELPPELIAFLNQISS